MNSRINKKKQLNIFKERHRAQEVETIPVSKENLKGLFDWLDAKLDKCDHTLKYTIQYLTNEALSENEIIIWLNEQGGYCDCEVLANVESKWRYYVKDC